VHLELDLMLRRVELLRLRPEDFRGDRVNVLGKGRMGGKWRTIPNHEDTKAIIGEYLLERRRMVEEARKQDPSAEIPPNLLIYLKAGKVHDWRKSGIDGRLRRLKDRVEAAYGRELDFSNHTLRRTGGRMLWEAKVKLETISAILGHENTSTTIDYLGLNYNDMKEGMEKLAQYQNAVNCPRNGTFRVEPDDSGGPKEIWTLDLPVISRALQPG
jgi:integrase/recombinase XerD